MGVKGQQKMDVNTMCEMTGVLNVQDQVIADECANIRKYKQQLDDSHVLDGGRIADSLNQVIALIINGTSKVSNVQNILAQQMDRVTSDMNELLNSKVADGTLSAAEANVQRTKMQRQ